MVTLNEISYNEAVSACKKTFDESLSVAMDLLVSYVEAFMQRAPFYEVKMGHWSLSDYDAACALGVLIKCLPYASLERLKTSVSRLEKWRWRGKEGRGSFDLTPTCNEVAFYYWFSYMHAFHFT